MERWVRAALAAAAVWGAGTPVVAQTTDFRVSRVFFLAVRASLFRSDQGSERVYGLYDASIAESARQVDALRSEFGDEVTAGDARSITYLDVARVREADPGSVLFLTSGLREHWDSVVQAAKDSGSITASVDRDCVVAQSCVISVKVATKVLILLSAAAARDAGVAFTPQFRMLAQEL